MYSGVTKLPVSTDALCAKTLGVFLNMINISLQYLSIHSNPTIKEDIGKII